jgi:hypothetical protein
MARTHFLVAVDIAGLDCRISIMVDWVGLPTTCYCLVSAAQHLSASLETRCQW